MSGLIASALKLILNNWKGSSHVTFPEEFNSLCKCLITIKFWDRRETNLKCLRRLGVSFIKHPAQWQTLNVNCSLSDVYVSHITLRQQEPRDLSVVMLQGYKTLFPPGILFLSCCYFLLLMY